MRSACVVLGALASAANAMPAPASAPAAPVVVARQNNATGPAVITQEDPDPEERARGVAIRDEGFVYGPSLIGEATPFLNGTLGNAWHDHDMALWNIDREAIDAKIKTDTEHITQTIGMTLGNESWTDLETVGDLMYEGQWKEANPRSTAPGIMTNYTQDLLFSMERLSQNPFSLQLIRKDEDLPFEIPDEDATKIASATLEELQSSGKLFYVDYSDQEHYEKSTTDPPKFGAACSAYFYLHPESDDFLPLAIKTNTDADLIYTPLDEDNDWLLAKMMFNVNDLFHGQIFHLTVTHDVSEGVHQAALHTMSENHPIMVLLDRMMYQAYNARIVGEWLCFNPGGHWDQLMYVSNVGCRTFVTEQYPTIGRYQAGYFKNDLKARGLLNDEGEHPFKEFPYFKDASRILDGYKTFFEAFVDSYYGSDEDVADDTEVLAWFKEATDKANVFDFPTAEDASKETLVDILTHFGFIVSVVHHALNGGDPIGSKATLPFHLPALNAPPPTKKGVTDLVPWIPDPTQAVHYTAFIASFNRPFYEDDGRTLRDAFGDEKMLDRVNDETRDAAKTFMNSMNELSDEIRGRGFDEEGLSLGMPFVYRTLDPGYIPFFCAV